MSSVLIVEQREQAGSDSYNRFEYQVHWIVCNGRMISNYKQQVRELLFKVLNRRSDRKSYTREGFIEMLKYYPLAMPKIYVSLF